MNQMKRQKNEIVKIYVFSMLQMILIRNLERVISRKADQDEESPNPSRQNNHPKDSWAEKLFSQDHFHMLSDWLSKLLINIILILRICCEISLFSRYNWYYFKTKSSNLTSVLELWLIEIGLWHQQRVVNVTKLSQLNSMIIQFSFLMMTNMKSFQLSFTFIKILMSAL